MSLERWELQMRQRGEDHAADIASVLRGEYGDVPLPIAEALPEIRRFTPEARQGLEEAGFAIYSLTGKSIKTLKDRGKPFWSTWHKDNLGFEAMVSRFSEVAINPGQLFLPESNEKTLIEQKKMVNEFSEGLEIKGTKAIIGVMPDYTELTFAHLDATDGYLFGEEFRYRYTRTQTPIDDSNVVAKIGFFHADCGLVIGKSLPDRGETDLFIAPLIVPSS